MTGLHIGTSGWSYDHWQDVLYSPGLPARERLARYTAAFDTVELNASFYRWPRDTTFAGWRRRLPDGFQLSVKAPRGLTHGRRLYGPDPWLDRISRCWHELGERRGVLLFRRAVAYTVMSGAGLPCVLRATAARVYVRLHGPDHTHLYAGSYSDADLRWWADRIAEWRGGGHEVYAYFNTDGGGHAVRNACATPGPCGTC